MHHNRHKEILKIVRQIAAVDQAGPGTPSSIAVGVTAGAGKRRGSFSTPTDTSSESTFTAESVRLTRRERKKVKKSGNGTPKDKSNLEIFSTDELDFISEAIHLTRHESKGAWAGTYNYGGQKHLGTPTAEDETDLEDAGVEEIADQFEDFSVKPIALMTPRQRRNLKKYTTLAGNNSFRYGTRKFVPGTTNGVYDGVEPQIFFRLGVEIANPVQNSKTRRDLITKLVAAIKEDLGIMKREEEESTMREEGFWRWAGRNAFDAIMRTREDFDWATGQKIGPTRGETYADYGEDDLGVEQGEIEPVINKPAIDKSTKALGRKVEAPRPATPRKYTPANDMAIAGPPSREIRFNSEKRVPKAIAAWSVPKSSKVENAISDFDDNSDWSDVVTLEKKKAPQASAPKVAAWSEVKSTKIFESTTNEVKKPVTQIDSVIIEEIDEAGDWEVVKKGSKGSAKPMSAPKLLSVADSRSVYRLPGDRTTIPLK